MSYVEQNWKNGDVITASKLNHMEDGIAGAGGVLAIGVTMDGAKLTLDKTWQAIYDAAFAVVKAPTGENSYTSLMVTDVFNPSEEVYNVTLLNGDATTTCSTTSADGYPSGEFD